MDPISPGRRGGLTWLAMVLVPLAFLPLVDGPRSDGELGGARVQCQPVVDLSDDVPDEETIGTRDVAELTADDVLHETEVWRLPAPPQPDAASPDYDEAIATRSATEDLLAESSTCDRERTQRLALTVLLLIPGLLLCGYVMVVPTATGGGPQRPGAGQRRADDDSPPWPGRG